MQDQDRDPRGLAEATLSVRMPPAPWTDDPADPLIGQVLAERFRILLPLGQGGMGRVYLAEDERLKCHVAVKCMDPSLTRNPEFREHFRREALVQANLSHPGIVQVRDVVTCSRGAFIVLEYSKGRSLLELLRLGPMRPDRGLALTAQVLEILDFAHRNGVIHRDLKPANILIEDRAGHELVRIVDFGIAKVLRDSGSPESEGTITRPGHMCGTVGYAAPEQAAGEPADHRADLYAAGVILFEMLTGSVPVEARSLASYIAKLFAQPPRTLAEVCPRTGFRTDLEALMTRALEREPARRFQSALSFLQAVREIRDDMERGAKPRARTVRSTLLPALPQGPARRRAASWLLGIVLLALAVGGWVAWQREVRGRQQLARLLQFQEDQLGRLVGERAGRARELTERDQRLAAAAGLGVRLVSLEADLEQARRERDAHRARLDETLDRLIASEGRWRRILDAGASGRSPEVVAWSLEMDRLREDADATERLLQAVAERERAAGEEVRRLLAENDRLGERLEAAEAARDAARARLAALGGDPDP
jgi:tRNA A-37 threonylcarbamoyl transferase component Bud32